MWALSFGLVWHVLTCADQLAAAMDDCRAKATELQGLRKQAGMLSVQLRSAEQGRLAAEADAREASTQAQVRVKRCGD